MRTGCSMAECGSDGQQLVQVALVDDTAQPMVFQPELKGIGLAQEVVIHLDRAAAHFYRIGLATHHLRDGRSQAIIAQGGHRQELGQHPNSLAPVAYRLCQGSGAETKTPRIPANQNRGVGAVRFGLAAG